MSARLGVPGRARGEGQAGSLWCPHDSFPGEGWWRAADGAGPGVPSAELSLGTGGHICPDDGRLALGSAVWKVRLSPRSSGCIAKNFKCLLLRQSRQGPKMGLQEFRASEWGARARPGHSRQPVALPPGPTFRPCGPSSRASEGPAAFIPRREAGWPSGGGRACSARVRLGRCARPLGSTFLPSSRVLLRLFWAQDRSSVTTSCVCVWATCHRVTAGQKHFSARKDCRCASAIRHQGVPPGRTR